MTKISMVGGLAAQVPANEYKDRAKEVPKKPFYNYLNMTSGQFRLSLINEQLGILASYYPEKRKEFEPAMRRIQNVLNGGLHSMGVINNGNSLVDRIVNQEIAKAKNKTRPASGVFIPNSIRGINIEPNQFIDNFSTNNSNPSQTNSVNPTDLRDYADTPNCLAILRERNKVSKLFNAQKWAELDAKKEACFHLEKMVGVLNQYLEPSAHHMLYAWADAPTASKFTPVGTKRILHRNAINAFSAISKIAKDDMNLWLRNGVLRQNAKGGIPPYQPEETVEIFKEGSIAKAQEGIGIDPVTLSVIVGAIIAAVTAVVDVMGKLRQQELMQLQAQAQGIGTPEMGPEEIDFYTNQMNVGKSLPKWMIPVGLAAGAGYIIWETIKK